MPRKAKTPKVVKNNDYKVFVDYLRRVAPGRVWTEQYLDIARDLLELNELTNDDKRLSLSIIQDKHSRYFLPVTISGRRILFGFYHAQNSQQTVWNAQLSSPSVCLFYNQEAFEELGNKYEEKIFQKGEREGEKINPQYLYLDAIDSILLFKNGWQRSVRSQLLSQKSTPNRSSHNPVIYQTIVNLDYRAALLNEVWPPSDEEKVVVSNGESLPVIVENQEVVPPVVPVQHDPDEYTALCNTLALFLADNAWKGQLEVQGLLGLNAKFLNGLQIIQHELAARYVVGSDANLCKGSLVSE